MDMMTGEVWKDEGRRVGERGEITRDGWTSDEVREIEKTLTYSLLYLIHEQSRADQGRKGKLSARWS